MTQKRIFWLAAGAGGGFAYHYFVAMPAHRKMEEQELANFTPPKATTPVAIGAVVGFLAGQML